MLCLSAFHKRLNYYESFCLPVRYTKYTPGVRKNDLQGIKAMKMTAFIQIVSFSNMITFRNTQEEYNE